MKSRCIPIIALLLMGSLALAQEPALETDMARLQRVLQPQASAQPHQPPVITSVAIQPSATEHEFTGRLLAAAGDDHSVQLWRFDTGQHFATLRGHDDWVRSVVFTPDGRNLITAGDDGRVLRWNLQSPTRPPVELYRQEPTLFDVAVSPPGDRLFIVGFDSKLRIVSLNTGELEAERSCSCEDIRTIAVSPDGRHVASGGRDGTIQLWSLPDCTCEGRIEAHTRRVRSLTFSRDGRWLISAGEDRSIVVTNVDDGSQVMRLSSGPAKVLAVAICGDHILASAGSDNLIRLWDLNRRTQLGRLTGHTGSVAALASNGEMLVSGSFDTTVRVWQVREALKELQARRKQEDRPAVR